MTLEELAKEIGTSAGHLHKWETDKVAVHIKRLNDIAKILKIGIHDLIADPSRFDSIPLLGVLDRSGNVELIEDYKTGKPSLFLDAPDGVDVETGAAILVAQDALQPIPNGWHLFFNRAYGGVPPSAIGNLCIVKREEPQNWLVRRVGKGSGPPLYNLFSPHATEILNTKLDWASPVICVRPPPSERSL